MDESESEDDEEDDDDANKSVVLNDGNKNEDDASLFGTSGGQSDLEGSDGGSGKSNLEEEDSSAPNHKRLDVSEGPVNENVSSDDSAEPEKTFSEDDGDQIENVSRSETSQGSDKVHLDEGLVGDQIVDQKQMDAEERMGLSPEVAPDSPEKNLDVSCAVIEDAAVPKEATPEKIGDEKSNEPLNFEQFNSAKELEVCARRSMS